MSLLTCWLLTACSELKTSVVLYIFRRLRTLPTQFTRHFLRHRCISCFEIHEPTRPTKGQYVSIICMRNILSEVTRPKILVTLLSNKLPFHELSAKSKKVNLVMGFKIVSGIPILSVPITYEIGGKNREETSITFRLGQGRNLFFYPAMG